MKITHKRKARLENERTNYIATVERLRKEKKDEYLLKMRERQKGKKAAVGRATETYSHSFSSITRPELLEKRHMYERMKKIAEGNKNELLVYHCDDMLMEINKWLKKKG